MENETGGGVVERGLIMGLAIALAIPLFAKIELGAPFANGMVLQRGVPINVWGEAKPNAKVRVAFGGQSVKAVVNREGRWRLKLPAMKEEKEPQTLVVICDEERVEIQDVLVGEVWLASGQSNMDVPLVGASPRYRDRQGALVAQIIRKPLVRFAQCFGDWKREPQRRLSRPLVWKKFMPETLGADNGISAVAAYFALDLHSALEVPVGVLCAHIGGTNIDAWTPREGTASVPELVDIANWVYYDTSNWPTNYNTYPWKRPRDQPAVLWNGLVEPLVPYSAKGMIWYQGCHNHPNGEWQRYCSKMHALFNGWRMRFENPDFVIRFVQLGTAFDAQCQQQAQFEREEPASAMAVICDVANKDDIHPNEKETVGRRLAVHALKRDYGFVGIQDNSPSVESVRREGTNLVVKCRDARSLYIYNANLSFDNNFELKGSVGGWRRAKIVNLAKPCKGRGKSLGLIDSPDEIVLMAPGIDSPVAVRYWYSPPYYGAVYNEVNLPLGPFEAKVGE